MINHLHLIVKTDNTIEFVRDFKKYTSKKILKNIEITEPFLLNSFTEGEDYKFWKKGNMPKFIFSEQFYYQKKNYILNNPIKSNYVTLAENWYWSSANKYCELKADEEYY